VPQLPPVLRYRLRAKPGDRPSSLAHTGEPLRESGPHDAAVRPSPPGGGHSAFTSAGASGDGAAAGGGGGGSGRLGWVEQYPSDFVYHQNLASDARLGSRARRTAAGQGQAGLTPAPPAAPPAAADPRNGGLVDWPFHLGQALLLPPMAVNPARHEKDLAGFDALGAVDGRCGPAAGGSGQWLPAGGPKADVAMYWRA
jgi:hypothetical protein